MRVAIRVDASLQIGTGHVMRCLTLAEVLKQQSAEVEFITRNHFGNIDKLINNKGFKVSSLPIPALNQNNVQELNSYAEWLGVDQETDAKETIQVLSGGQMDWLIVDHYALDIDWEERFKTYFSKIMVIDDLANRRHDCNLLVDQTYGRKQKDYKQWVPNYCKLLLGSSSALLRPDFEILRTQVCEQRKKYTKINRVMISMGSLDETNITERVLDSLLLIVWEELPIIDIILTSKAPYLKVIKNIAFRYPLPINIQINATNMAELMFNADLAIGSGGTTSWERCCMGLPTILIVLAENQALIGKNLAQVGATITLQEDNSLEKNIKNTIIMLMKNKKKYMKLSNRAMTVCDGTGASNIVQALLK